MALTGYGDDDVTTTQKIFLVPVVFIWNLVLWWFLLPFFAWFTVVALSFFLAGRFGKPQHDFEGIIHSPGEAPMTFRGWWR